MNCTKKTDHYGTNSHLQGCAQQPIGHQRTPTQESNLIPPIPTNTPTHPTNAINTDFSGSPTNNHTPSPHPIRHKGWMPCQPEHLPTPNPNLPTTSKHGTALGPPTSPRSCSQTDQQLEGSNNTNNETTQKLNMKWME